MTFADGLGRALRICLDRELTFVAFRKPGTHASLWVQRSATVETVEPSLLYEVNDVFLISPFDRSGDRLSIIRPDVGYLFSDPTVDLELLTECSGARPNERAIPRSTEAEDFERAAAKAISAIGSGTLEKVVLSRVIHATIRPDELPDLFLLALEEYPDAMVVLLNTPEHGTWIGATPEMLVRAEEDEVQVDALAGTMAYSDPALELRTWGSKELDEQELVTRGVLNAFLEMGSPGVRVRGPEVIRAGPVAHLRSSIHAELGDRPLSDIVLALHPTPAVCGTPTAAARQFIREHEAHERRLYAGFWGPWAPDGRTDLYVNIRCMEVVSEHAVIYTGAGITIGSDPRKEWSEAGEKARTWLDLMGGSGGEG